MIPNFLELPVESLHSLLSESLYGRDLEEFDDCFYLADLGEIVNKHTLWVKELPRVHPHYAVKCNSNKAVLQVLSQLDTGFDCASKAEIETILNLGVHPDRIIYANPCKQRNHIVYAKKKDVKKMTFDNEIELIKIKDNFPDAELVLRLLPPDETKCQCPLGMKFGCNIKDVPSVLQTAKQLQLNVIGISFHVGSGCYDAQAFVLAVEMARESFDIGNQLGFNFTLLDIGGGFPGNSEAKLPFEEICSVLRPSLDEHFPVDCGVQIISEPGRYFVETAFTLVANVISKKAVYDSITETNMSNDKTFYYHINDSIYGSFNCLIYDHAKVQPYVLKNKYSSTRYKSIIWGQTFNEQDCIAENIHLPEISIGDWIIFPYMGAYTLCAGSKFSGLKKPKVYYIKNEISRKLEEDEYIPLSKIKFNIDSITGFDATAVICS